MGWKVVEQLQSMFAQTAVEFIQLDRPGVTLLEVMRPFDQVVLVDAVLSDGVTEAVRSFSRDELVQRSTDALSSHSVGVAEAVALGSTLGELPESLSLVGVEIPSGGELDSDRLKQAVAAVVALLGDR